jgi:hypothetical protein
MAIELERLVLSAPHLHHVGSEQLSLPNLATAAFREWKRMNVEKVLRDYGQFLRPMNEAPRDGRRILGQSASVLVNCYWEINPSKLAGPTWVEDNDADHGYCYLDRYFNGWIDLRKFKLLDYAALARLIIAYIDDARAMDDREALNALDRRSKT